MHGCMDVSENTILWLARFAMREWYGMACHVMPCSSSTVPYSAILGYLCDARGGG